MGSQPNHTVSTSATTQLGITIGTYHPLFGHGTISDTTTKQAYSQQGADWPKVGSWIMTVFAECFNLPA